MMPLDALRPHDHRITSPADGGVILPSTLDGIGTVAGLKANANIDHAEDDAYLTTLLQTAQTMVGDYTHWPMRTTNHVVEARWAWPLPVTPGRVDRRAYPGHHRRRSLLLPGPVNTLAMVRTREYQNDVLVDGIDLTGAQRYPRMPHDATLVVPDEVSCEYDDGGYGEFIIRYTVSWESVYTGSGDRWPAELAHVIYRAASTLYLYREATVMGDRPTHRVIQATLGSYLPVTL